MAALQPQFLAPLKELLQQRFVPHLPPLLGQGGREDKPKKQISRAFSAFVLQQKFDLDVVTAAKAVMDDYEDHGIDAIYYHEADQTLYLIQSKMKEDAQFQLGEAQAFIEGVKLLLNKQFQRFNQNVQNLQANIETALDECESIQLLVAYTGNGITIQAQNYLQPAIQELIDEGEEQIAPEYQEYTATDVEQALRSEHAVDALISELEKLIAKKQAIKTATMQQLLTGRTRLPAFALREDGSLKGTKPTELGEIPEDWEVVNVGDLGQVDPENLGSTTSPDYEFNYVSLEQIEKGVLVGTARTIFRNAPSRARRVLKKGDILVSTVRPNLMSHYFVQHEVNDLICSTGFSVIRFFEEKLCPGYLYQHLFSSVINNQIEMLISGSNYPAINSGDVKQLKVQIGSVEEQTAIATILSDMDAEIQALEQHLGKTRQIKQGMMQELLTGKTRLVQGVAND
ncbi:restriction endonuclease subunit S [Marinagarivorans algicola]|uniref:restriction endonuclease subunit S n=1 Tax=Marinagarivorans algicola TaxID=1513270 RepID=UPI000AE9E535|nr:restriction endonuclease subunit S [Marinagarivorans algicola]